MATKHCVETTDKRCKCGERFETWQAFYDHIDHMNAATYASIPQDGHVQGVATMTNNPELIQHAQDVLQAWEPCPKCGYSRLNWWHRARCQEVEITKLVRRIKAEPDPLRRIALYNDPQNGSAAVRIAAMLRN